MAPWLDEVPTGKEKRGCQPFSPESNPSWVPITQFKLQGSSPSDPSNNHKEGKHDFTIITHNLQKFGWDTRLHNHYPRSAHPSQQPGNHVLFHLDWIKWNKSSVLLFLYKLSLGVNLQTLPESSFFGQVENSGDPWLKGRNSQNISFFESIYLIMATMSTVGFGDVVPKTSLGRIFIIVFTFGSLVKNISYIFWISLPYTKNIWLMGKNKVM